MKEAKGSRAWHTFYSKGSSALSVASASAGNLLGMQFSGSTRPSETDSEGAGQHSVCVCVLIILFIHLICVLAVLGLCCCTWAFSSCDEQGLLASWGPQASRCWWLLLLQNTASRVCGLSSCSSRALEHWFNSCGTCGLSCSTARELFSDQGSNPCLLHWQADSLPLSYQ